MTRLLQVPTSPPSEVKKGFIGLRLSYELNNMCLANMNMACCFLLKLQVIETSFKERYIIIRDEIIGKGVQFILVVAITIISTMTGTY
jgi:hypothetical protein